MLSNIHKAGTCEYGDEPSVSKNAGDFPFSVIEEKIAKFLIHIILFFNVSQCIFQFSN